MENLNSDDIKDYHDILQSCLLSVRDDFTQLWVFSGIVAEAFPNVSFEGNLRVTKAVVKEMMNNYGVRVIDEITEEPNEMSSEEAMSEIEKTYARLGRLPNVGGGPWFG